MKAVCTSLCVCMVSFGSATAGTITLGDISSPVIEPFEGIIGVDVPPGLFSGAMFGAPPAGFVMPSGLKFIFPDPNDPKGADFIIGDYLFDQGGGLYGLLENGSISSPADLRSGTAYAAAGAPFDPLWVFRFEFPIPAVDFGVFASASLGDGASGEVTLTTFDLDGAFIESFTFSTLPVPLTDENFIGLGGKGAIGSFEISSDSFFAFDDVIWETIPAPPTLALLCLAGVAGARSRRRALK